MMRPAMFGDHWFNKLSAAIEAEEGSKKALDAMIAEPAFFDALAMGLDGQHEDTCHRTTVDPRVP